MEIYDGCNIARTPSRAREHVRRSDGGGLYSGVGRKGNGAGKERERATSSSWDR